MAASQQTTFAGVLQSIKVGDVPRVKNVITITSSDSLEQGFQKLADNHILSAPVWSEAENSYTGFLDVRDLVSFVVFLDDENHAEVPQELTHLIGHGARYFKLPVENVTVTYLSRRNPFHPVKDTDSLFDVAKILTKKQVHRVPVLGEDGKVVSIISQTTIASILNKHAKECKEEAIRTVRELELGTAPVVSLPKTAPAIEVFRVMDSRKLSGVAIVDDQNRLVGNTSGSDVKLFLKSMNVAVTQKPIFDFLKELRMQEIDIHTTTIAISRDDNLAKVIATFAATKVHRLFVADDKAGFVPERVVAISDVLKYVLGMTSHAKV